MCKKKAAAHIEMVISFGLFLLFVFLMLVYIRPIRNQGIGDVLLNTVYTGIRENASTSLIKVPLSVNVQVPCFIVPNQFDTMSASNILVKDTSENALKFRLHDNSKNISIESSTKNFYYIYYSNDTFTSQTLTSLCPMLNSSQYFFSSASIYNALSKGKLEVLKAQYADNYDSLKNQLHFPFNYQFTLEINSLLTGQQLIAMTRSKPKGVEIDAMQLPVEVLDNNGYIIKAIMVIQVW